MRQAAVAVVVAALVATTAVVTSRTHSIVLLCYWYLGAIVITFCVVTVIKGRRFPAEPAVGRVLAIIPCYNEEQAAVDLTVRALLAQTYPIEQIHVIDDGSKVPVVPWDQPPVTWHRIKNVGKRGAHCHALRLFGPEDFDYVLTVDSDSEPYPDALEKLMHAMADPRVQAATGMIYIRNFRDNLITAAADMDIGMSCVMMRSSRTLLGAIETTSGALALYRSKLIYDYLDGYAVECGTGDDRWLSIRALIRGDVVAVPDAGVETDMPPTIKGTYRQRLRWARSWWWMIPFVFTNLPFRKLLSPIWGMTQLVITPAFMTVIAINYSLGWRTRLTIFAAIYLMAYCVVRGGVAALYLIPRPNISRREKLRLWLVGTPASVVMNVFLLSPIRYWALFRLRDNRWRSR